jgi:hypothetical protein
MATNERHSLMIKTDSDTAIVDVRYGLDGRAQVLPGQRGDGPAASR